MANVSGASLAPIYNRLNAAPSYHPLEADTFADWSLEAGDIVTVTRDGKSYESPVHSSTVTWKKGQQVKVSSGGNEERDSVSKMSQRKFNRGSSGLRATEERYRQIETSYNGMRSGLILASSSAALYVNNKYTQMQSGLFLTESSAHLYTNNRYTQMQSGLKLTESSAHLYTNNRYTQMQSGLKLTESSAHLYTNNRYTQMQSGLKLTESSAHLYTNNRYTQMQSGLKLTESSAHLYTNNRYTQMQSGLKLTESSAHLYTNNRYTQMQSGLKLTESSAHLYTNNRYTQMQSGLKLTESSAHLYTNNRYTQMQSGLKLTESSAHLYTNNRYTQMQSGLKLTESSAHLYTNNRYTQMQSGLKLTESSAHLYTNNRYTQMSSGLSLSSSSAALYVNNKYTQMKSGLVLSESSARLYVDSKYTQMQAGLSLTESSAMLYAKNRTTRAYILTRINADGEGEALIDADKIKLRGDVTLDGVMYVGSGSNIMFSGNILAQLNGGAGGGISANTLVVNPNGCLTFGGTNPLIQIYGSDMATAIKSASASNNTLTLTRFNGTSVNFSKATWQTGEWSSSGAFTARAKQQNGQSETEVSTITRHLTTGTRSWSGNTCTVPIRAWYGNTPPTYEDCNFNVTVDASARYNAGFDAVTGNDITLQGDGTSPQSSKPSIAATWSETSSGKKKVAAYIWAKHSNGSWYKLRSFSFTEP